jgi:hypothetical protein
MIEIKDLLSNFENLLVSESFKKREVKRIILEEAKIDIKTEDIQLKNGTIFLNIKPIYKNEIFFKKDKILSKLRESLDKESPGDVI